MTADVVKDRRPRQGTSQDILKGGRGGDGSPCLKERVLTRLPCRPPSRVLLNVIKKDLKTGVGGEVTGIPELPPSLPLASYVLVSGSQEAESNSLLVFPSFTITA